MAAGPMAEPQECCPLLPARLAPLPQRVVNELAIIPWLVAVMVFPIGILTGALTNLSTAVCGGTPGVHTQTGGG